MKNTKNCSKCQSTDIIIVQGTRQGFGWGNNLKLGATTLSAIVVTKYVCGTCGFMEDWIDDLQDIEKVKKYYLKPTK
ncbi:MAG: hypothetical protein LBI19_09545 [Oscillospiraceae bacterium]|jgi:hypothetical protein|nr:hypothetical protein [Oscillospiraceae bacterium]